METLEDPGNPLPRSVIRGWPSKANIKRARKYILEKQCCGFFDGGCLIFADAMRHLIPELKIATIMSKKWPEHYGVFLPKRFWGDASGLYSNKQAWVKRFAKAENVSEKLFLKEELILSETVIRSPSLSKKIAKILRGD